MSGGQAFDPDDPTVDPDKADDDAGASSSALTGRTWYGRRRRAPGQPRRKAPWWELPALIVGAVLVAIVVKTFVVQPFYIPSGSMEHTLHGCKGCSNNDRILVNKPIYNFRDPEPGDIVVFHAPPGWSEPTTHPPSNLLLRGVRGFGQLIGFVPPDGEVLVKRVIATGGQTIKGTASGVVMVSDHGSVGPFRTLNEPFVFDDPGGTQPAFGPVTVPKGRLWVMGDHRTNSEDSRWHCTSNGESDGGKGAQCAQFVKQATVPIGNVIGKAVVIAWPPDRWRTLGTPVTFDSAAQAVGPELPGAASLAVAIPIFAIGRRRRSRV